MVATAVISSGGFSRGRGPAPMQQGSSRVYSSILLRHLPDITLLFLKYFHDIHVRPLVSELFG